MMPVSTETPFRDCPGRRPQWQTVAIRKLEAGLSAIATIGSSDGIVAMIFVRLNFRLVILH
jgi:hypothetical protein